MDFRSAGILPASLTFPQSAHARSACCAGKAAQKVGKYTTSRRCFGAHPTPEARAGEAAPFAPQGKQSVRDRTTVSGLSKRRPGGEERAAEGAFATTKHCCAGKAAQKVGNWFYGPLRRGSPTAESGRERRGIPSLTFSCAGEPAQVDFCSAGILPAILVFPQSALARSAGCAGESAQVV